MCLCMYDCKCVQRESTTTKKASEVSRKNSRHTRIVKLFSLRAEWLPYINMLLITYEHIYSTWWTCAFNAFPSNSQVCFRIIPNVFQLIISVINTCYIVCVCVFSNIFPHNINRSFIRTCTISHRLAADWLTDKSNDITCIKNPSPRRVWRAIYLVLLR